ncbi:rhamnan synthesis F family protein [Gluconacetobacter asukensis]|uniref:Rhamnan synthesis protein F n=1 Tax=Gluconacetobacter asukensis TaxID=1017181 RepID=A0A7W4P0X8_9PROT|nr:rhamnan synthesis F family protein [Gluconacetobacter asukensis]MBB2171163.1 hypothetical protein [Gluconacetobacter asukensis]
MPFLKSIYREYHIARKFVSRSFFRRIFIDLNIKRQKELLKSYKSDIKDVIELSILPSDIYCIFVYYELAEDVSDSVKRVILELRRHDVNIILACNHEMTITQKEFFIENCSAIIFRGNQGFDFGAYKDAIQYLDRPVSRLIIMNDSVFFSSHGLKEMIQRLLGPEDVIAAYENWSGTEHHHLQSFCLSVSGHVFNARSFRQFWNTYIPVNNRVYAIEHGEKKLSQAILNAARDTHVIYSVSALYKKLKDKKLPLREEPFLLPRPWRDRIFETDHTEPYDYIATKTVELINITSPIHAGAYYFPSALGSPLFKKDIVYRHRFDFWEVETWIPDIMSEDDADEYLTILRKRGDENKLSRLDRIKYDLGVK